MQNFNNPQQPPQPPQPPAKKKMSTGVKVLIGVIVVALLGGVLVVTLGAGALYYFSRGRARDVAVGSSGAPGGTGSSSSDTDDAEPPAPTAEQQAAIAGGQSAEWAQQEITWTVPQKWKQETASSNQLMWSSPGSADAAHLIVNISPMAANFPAEISLQSNYDSFKQDKQKYDEVRWLALGGVKGILFRESSPEDSDDSQRLHWMGYRDYKGQKQLINIMLASQGKYFARHEDEMYGVLYSTDF